jgi:hypothetical protein
MSISIDEASEALQSLSSVMSAEDAQIGLDSLLKSLEAKGLSLENLHSQGWTPAKLKQVIPDALAFQAALHLIMDKQDEN